MTFSTHSEGNTFEMPDSGSWSQWFPRVNGRYDIKSIYRERPDDVCLNALDTQYRKVHDEYQVRFMCPAGAIHSTDVPHVPSTNAAISNAIWTVWFDMGKPGSGDHAADDVEDFTKHKKERPNQVCQNPIAVQGQTVDGIFALETGDVFEAYSIRRGLICRGKHQVSGKCYDYRVRYLCPQEELRKAFNEITEYFWLTFFSYSVVS